MITGMHAPKVRVFLATAVPLLVIDRVSKMMAYGGLQPIGIPHDLLGTVVRFTLMLNREAAMNITLGGWSRWGLAAIAVAGIALVLVWLRATPAHDATRAAALGLIAGGAAGNLVDRIRWEHGVVDFIDIGLGPHRFWTFNVADIGVTIGAVLLAMEFARDRPPTAHDA
ncbi:MAG: signal peptidase II [Gemmatimonadales bacterium]